MTDEKKTSAARSGRTSSLGPALSGRLRKLSRCFQLLPCCLRFEEDRQTSSAAPVSYTHLTRGITRNWKILIVLTYLNFYSALLLSLHTCKAVHFLVILLDNICLVLSTTYSHHYKCSTVLKKFLSLLKHKFTLHFSSA